jgi:hypothetical protein
MASSLAATAAAQKTKSKFWKIPNLRRGLCRRLCRKFERFDKGLDKGGDKVLLWGQALDISCKTLNPETE